MAKRRPDGFQSAKISKNPYFFRLLLLLVSLAVISGQAFAGAVFDLLRMDLSPRGGAMGGHPVALPSENLDAVTVNPAWLAGNDRQRVSLVYEDHLLDLSAGDFAYGRPIGGGYIAGALSYFSYGDFDRYPSSTFDSGPEGTYSAEDLLLTAVYARTIRRGIQIGAGIRYIHSRIDEYSSSGAGLDAGFYWETGIDRLAIAATVSNLGMQLASYDGYSENMPMLVRFGFSKGLEHLPLRLGATAHYEPGAELFFTGSGEFEVSQYLVLRGGYTTLGSDYRMDTSADAVAGISAGIGIRKKMFNFDYAIHSLGPAGIIHRFGFGYSF